MRVPALVILLAAAPLRAQVANPAPALSDPERAALERLGQAPPTTFDLVDSWFAGRPIQYYDFGRDAARATILYRVQGGDDVVANASAIPGIPGYSDMWQVQFVQVGPGFEPGSYRDYRGALADARAGRFRLIDPEVVVNCPVMYVDGRPAAR